MPKKTFFLQEIGEIDFVKHKRAKYLKIAVKSTGKIRVTVPFLCSYEEAKNFARQKTDKIKKYLQQLDIKNNYFDENTVFNTKNHKLKIKKYSEDICKYFISEGTAEFYYPESANVLNPEIQLKIKNFATELMRHEAKHYLPIRVDQLAEKHGFKYKRVFVKNLKSRWGSCSNVNNINLNLHLMRLPEHLTDYVILHELAHTREKNHGKGFYKLLEDLVPGAKKLDRELRSFSPQL